MLNEPRRQLDGVFYLFACLFMIACSGGTSPTNEGPTYSVSIKLTGLEGEIQVSYGNESTTITEDGTYVVIAELTEGDAYELDWTTPPYQNCEAGLFSGTIEEADIEIEAVCENKEWSHPENLLDYFSLGNSDVEDFDIAMNENGDTLIAWQQEDSTGEDRIFLAEYIDGVWSKPEDEDDYIAYESNDGGDSPKVALNGDGDALVVYTQTQNTLSYVHFSQKVNGSWSHPSATDDQVLSPADSEGYRPAISMNENGEAIALWRGDTDLSHCETGRSSCYQVFKAELRSENWATPEDRFDYLSFKDHMPNGDFVSDLNGEGQAVIAWMQYIGEAEPCSTFACSGDQHLYVAGYDNGVWTFPSGPMKTTSPKSRDCYDEIGLGLSSSGDVLLTWRQGNSSDLKRVFRAERMDGTWTKPSGVDDFFSPDDGDGDVDKFHTTQTSDGEAVILWTDISKGESGEAAGVVLYSEKRDGIWTDPSSVTERINLSGDEIEAYSGRPAMDSHGRVILPWTEHILPDYESAMFFGEKRAGENYFPSSGDDRISPTKEVDPHQYDAYDSLAVASESGHAAILFKQVIEDPETPGTGGTEELFLSHFR